MSHKKTIPKLDFGESGHKSTRIIFGGYALSEATRAEADEVRELLVSYGVNHLDTAPMYGNSEKLIGSWMQDDRDQFFLATKTRKRTYEGAWADLERSLERLDVDYVDLWQMHGLTNPAGWEKTMESGGAIKAFIEARERGLVRFLGVTGHGSNAPAMHKKSLDGFEFDSVLLPYSYWQMQDPHYASEFNQLIEVCQDRKVAVQTIKSVARRPWQSKAKTYNTYFYEPLESGEAIDSAVQWALALPDSFVITAGDLRLQTPMLNAAARFEKRPPDSAMKDIIEKFEVQPIFSY